ncbi:1-aminocyclopropane-1-carboxylate synthase [Chloropicon primus]|uniref:1-aminocyclopropane-1-carboxylate synthase n=1 Tax=Chloropicon primus TaxID=1764295 RepID=A0A5B8MVR5_9CHLO|nr:1-aminocyclopropane-1-carboxylate synthase [Chloropicon primus]|eukprot:QDZ24643.1 1-aminocyclopropane-1-carboxylate synthase [Chloropicon primus]
MAPIVGWLEDAVRGMTRTRVVFALAGLTFVVTLNGMARRRRRRRGGKKGTEGEEQEKRKGRAAMDLSLRSMDLTKPALSYLDVFLEALGNQWTPSMNKEEGYICLLIAENKLTTSLVSKRFKQVKTVPDSVFAYTSFRGEPRFRQAVANYVEMTFCPQARIDPENLAISSGCGAVCEAGEEVLIPSPYYPAFDNDLRVRSRVLPVPVLCSTATFPLPSNEDLDKAFAACRSPRILLLTNPHNPLGVVLEPEEVMRCVKWALQRGMHVVSDEIYANSVHGAADGAEFKSVIAMMPELSGMLGKELIEERVHTIFGFSKDFCASGLRIGCLHTKNLRLLAAIDNVGYFGGVSGHTAHIMTEVLEDKSFVKKFVQKNQENLRKSYNTLVSKLKEADIGFLPAGAGMFLWIDLRKYLSERSWEAEKTLWTGLAKDAKVLFTPGKDCHAKAPGFFRVCFAWVPEQALVIAVDRIVRHLRKNQLDIPMLKNLLAE